MGATLPEKPISGLWYLLKGYKIIFLSSIFCQFILHTIEASRLFVVRFIIDDVIGTSAWESSLFMSTLVYIGLILIIGILSFLISRGYSISAEGLTRDLRNKFFDHVQRLSFPFHDETKSGDLIQRASSDIGIIHRFYKILFRDLTAFVLIFFINFFAIFILNWKLLVFSLIITPLYLIMAVYFFRRIEKAQDKLQDQEAKLSTVTQENLSGIRVVRAFSRQKYEIEKFTTENKKNYRYGLTVGNNHTIFWPLSDTIFGIQVITAYVFAGILVFNGEISIGTFIAFSGMISNLIWPLRGIGRIFTEISKVSISYKRVSKIVEEEQKRYYLLEEQVQEKQP
jgi:ATP-binding cassette subfamily B protein